MNLPFGFSAVMEARLSSSQMSYKANPSLVSTQRFLPVRYFLPFTSSTTLAPSLRIDARIAMVAAAAPARTCCELVCLLKCCKTLHGDVGSNEVHSHAFSQRVVSSIPANPPQVLVNAFAWIAWALVVFEPFLFASISDICLYYSP